MLKFWRGVKWIFDLWYKDNEEKDLGRKISFLAQRFDWLSDYTVCINWSFPFLRYVTICLLNELCTQKGWIIFFKFIHYKLSTISNIRAVFSDNEQKSQSLWCVFQFFSILELWHVHGVEMNQAGVKKFSSLKSFQLTFKRKIDPRIRIDKGLFT